MRRCPGSTNQPAETAPFSDNALLATALTPLLAKQNGGGVASWAVVAGGRRARRGMVQRDQDLPVARPHLASAWLRRLILVLSNLPHILANGPV
jgi:hypothetical protein